MIYSIHLYRQHSHTQALMIAPQASRLVYQYKIGKKNTWNQPWKQQKSIYTGGEAVIWSVINQSSTEELHRKIVDVMNRQWRSRYSKKMKSVKLLTKQTNQNISA